MWSLERCCILVCRQLLCYNAILLKRCLMWSLVWFYFMVTLCLGLAMHIFVWKNYRFKIFGSTIHITCVVLPRRESQWATYHLNGRSRSRAVSGARKNVSVKNYFHSILTTFLCPEPILLSSRLSAVGKPLASRQSIATSDVNEVVQSRRRPLLGPSPGWKLLLPLLN